MKLIHSGALKSSCDPLSSYKHYMFRLSCNETVTDLEPTTSLSVSCHARHLTSPRKQLKLCTHVQASTWQPTRAEAASVQA